MIKRICTNCGKEVNRTLQYDMCPACARFFTRHGVLRSPETMTRLPPGSNQRTCKNCHEGKALVKELCKTCYDYKKRTGKNRPKHLVRGVSCSNCGKPENGPKSITKGRCRNCYYHWHKYGKDRIIIPPVWCDCGEVAVHFDIKLSFTLGTGHTDTAKYNLCQACYDLEHEPVQTRNEVKWNR